MSGSAAGEGAEITVERVIFQVGGGDIENILVIVPPLFAAAAKSGAVQAFQPVPGCILQPEPAVVVGLQLIFRLCLDVKQAVRVARRCNKNGRFGDSGRWSLVDGCPG